MGISYYIAKMIKLLHLPAIKNSTIHHTSKVSSLTHLVNISMNKYSFVGSNCTVINAKIGSFCSIADNVIIGGSSHPINWVSSSSIFHDGKNIFKKNFSTHPFQATEKTIIKNDVWIGSNCLIKGGVTIGTGSIVGMGSIVTKNIGSYEIWAGNPAKLIRKRFDDSTIESLQAIKWWEWNDKKLENNSEFMNDILEFIKLNKQEEPKEGLNHTKKENNV